MYAGDAPAAADPAVLPVARSADALSRFAPWVVLAWLAGVGALSVRAAGGWIVAGRLARRETRPAPPGWESRVRELSARLSIRRPVRLLESLRVEVPSAIGTLRPVILLPAGIATGMTAEQLDALLAHELAHVRRRDFLVNLLQVAAETLLFYHPAVWWVSHRIRVERENACDDLAVEVTGDATRYARALVALEERRPARVSPGLAVALYGAGDAGRLARRIARLLPSGEMPARSTARPLAAVLALSGALAIGAGSRVVFLRTFPHRPPRSPLRLPPPRRRPSRGRTGRGGLLTPEQLVAFRIHDVTPEFIDAIESLGYTNFSPDDLIALRVHDVSPDAIRQMKELFGNVSLEECVAFQIHGVTPELVREFRSLGLTISRPTRPSHSASTASRPQYVREIQGLGYSKIDADELVAFRIHGVTPDCIRAINQSAGGRVSADDLIETRIFGREEDEEENP